jgi:glycosyltransferase involved in cell wall biosynthesis
MYGASRSLIKLTKILNEEYNVFVLIPEKGVLYPNLNQIISDEKILIYEGLYFFTRKSFKLKYLLSTVLCFIRNIFFLIKIINKFQITIIHTNSGVVPAPALAAKLSGKKHIWHIREWFGDFKKFLPVYSAYITIFSDKVVCVSQAMAIQFIKAKNVLTIHNGFEIPNVPNLKSHDEELDNKLKSADLIIGCTSRIRLIRKGQEYLIEAIGLLTHKTGKNIQAILIGDYVPGYEYQKEVFEGLITKYNLEGRIHFLGHLNEPLPFYQFFDVFVLPSGEPEPFGGVIIEAMSMGLPVIGSNLGGTAEQIAHEWNGFLFENKNSHDLLTKLQYFLDNKSELKIFGSRSLERVKQNFTLDIHRYKILYLL